MEFSYLGGSSFVLKGERTVTINPDSAASADIVLRTEPRTAGRHIVNGPGEYEIGGVLIVTTRPDRSSQRLVHAVNVDGINILHVDVPSVSLTDGDLTAMGKIDVLLVNATDVKAAEALATDLSPRIVMPFGQSAEQLCAILGVRDAQPQPKLVWNGTGTAPRAVLLKAQATRRRSGKAA